MKFNPHTEQIYDHVLFNQLIELAEQRTVILPMMIEDDPFYQVKYSLANVSYLFAGPKNIILTTKVSGRATTFYFTLDGTEHTFINGGQAYCQLVKACINNPWKIKLFLTWQRKIHQHQVDQYLIL